ncbi:hypothetical protein F53441_14197 [Fusarium austroafricanum]|uniref:Rhodopsin domain-containing protein n=1 Tax=Fusarium austroafricanum TaxID=2364996 RepID=A0A8H4JHK7_9HYPO|nr:hypothetical protein F53441_14197 [Fusarium austroafricanum]
MAPSGPTGPGPVVVLVSQWTLLVIAAGIISARFYLRLQLQKRKLLTSDILMCFAWLSAVATAAFDIKFAQMGALEPQVNTELGGFKGSLEEIAFILKLFWASSIPFFTTFYLCKAALLSVFLQVFPRTMRRRRIVLWSRDPDTACPAAYFERTFQVAWALHFSGDLLIFLLPWLVITKLQMKLAMKLGVYCTFLLGLINMVFCIVRFVSVQTATVDSKAALSLVDLWSSLDANIGLVVACLPSLRPYIRRRGQNDNYHSSSAQQYSRSRLSSGGPYLRHREPDSPDADKDHLSTPRTVNESGEIPLDDRQKSQSSVIELIYLPK